MPRLLFESKLRERPPLSILPLTDEEETDGVRGEFEFMDRNYQRPLEVYILKGTKCEDLPTLVRNFPFRALSL